MKAMDLNAIQQCFAVAIIKHNDRLKAIRMDASATGRAYAWEREQALEQAFRPVWLWAVNRWGLAATSDIVRMAHRIA